MSCEYLDYRGGYYCKKANKSISSGTYDKYCKWSDTRNCTLFNESSSSGGCFLTSACTNARGLDDDCYELTTLRSFRDTWLKSQPGGSNEIKEYYRIAPKIVEEIDSRSDKFSIYERIYEQLVSPCLRLIENKEYDAAFALYKDQTLALAASYLRE